MTIRAKLYAAIALTVLGPLLTTVVALEGQSRLGDSFDEVQQRADDAALAQEIKFDVTDTNGWQTAYGYAGDGRFRRQYELARDRLDESLGRAEYELTESAERGLVGQLRVEFDRFLALDEVAYAALAPAKPRGSSASSWDPSCCGSRRWPILPSAWPITRSSAPPRLTKSSARTATGLASG